MTNHLRIGSRSIGSDQPVFIVAEMSANHGQRFEDAVKIMEAAKEAGADAVKLQTYTPDTLTINCDKAYFNLEGTEWESTNLYELYSQAYTPWEWQPRLKKIAEDLGLMLFSTPFDETAVDFLEQMDVPCYKVASFEVVDLPLLRKIARTGKPIIMSTGMATLAEIDEAVRAVRESGCRQLALLRCTSAYPALLDEMNLRTIPDLSQAFHVPVGLSDHSLDPAVPIVAVALGACLIEKHFTLSRSCPNPDSSFSVEPHEFKAMVDAVRTTERALGAIHYGVSTTEATNLRFRRSLFVIRDMKVGDTFSKENVRSIRPGHGLHTRHLEDIMGKRATRDIERGEPLSWDMVSAPLARINE